MISQELLRMENISKEFYGNKVLHDINFTINKGEILGLVGENGAGKSTLMKILFGMRVISSTGGYNGRIILEGKEITFANPLAALDAGIGMVHQEFSLLPGFTATENIVLNCEPTKNSFLSKVFGPRINLLDRAEMNQRAQKAIKALDVDLDPEMLVSEMPIGHKQFTEISREIARSQTKLLVLDEPTAVLTESEAEIMLVTLRKLAAEGIAIIFITHRLQEIFNVADNIIVLRDGVISKETPVKEATIKDVAKWMVGRDIKETAKTKIPDFSQNETILNVKNLWVDMPGETVRDVNLEVYQGEIFGIGGLAGQGKLGIPNGIMGLFPAGGSIKYKNKDLPLDSPREVIDKGIAFVSEDRRGVGLLLDEPIDWNISFTAMQVQDKYLKSFLGGLIKWRDDETMSKSAKEYIEMLEVRCVDEKQLTGELSGGNQQKICLAKAFALKPDLLFVSEPTRGIDIGAKKLVLDALRKYNAEFGTTIIIISSELEELRSIAHRIAIVGEGKIAGTLPPTADASEFGLLMIGDVKE